MTPCRLVSLALTLGKLSRSFSGREGWLIVQVKTNLVTFMVSNNLSPSPLTIPDSFIDVLDVTYSQIFLQ